MREQDLFVSSGALDMFFCMNALTRPDIFFPSAIIRLKSPHATLSKQNTALNRRIAQQEETPLTSLI